MNFTKNLTMLCPIANAATKFFPSFHGAVGVFVKLAKYISTLLNDCIYLLPSTIDTSEACYLIFHL